MPDAVIALMEALSCVPGVQAHRYSGQQELAQKKTAEIKISAVWWYEWAILRTLLILRMS
jgi:hypothetical protein